jgi:hypothetical protein
MYNDESKYTGPNDNFDYKLDIFHDLCSRASVPETAKAKAYPTMLTSLALDHYYTNLCNVARTLPFDQLCNATRNYFEGPEHRRSVLNKWNSTTLQTVIDKNTGKSTHDCLQLLIKELRHLQHGLDYNLRTDNFLHSKLVTACQKLPSCQYACFKPSDSLAGLINDLQSSITTYEESHPNESTQAFFTDRRFHRQQPSRFPPPRPPRNNTTKRCFVCNKEGCWSTKHTQEEREESRKRFKDKFTQRFDRHARQYITEYEGIASDSDADNHDSLDEAIDNLIIEFESSEPAEDQAKLFLTSFGEMQRQEAIEATTALADRSFTHALARTTPTTADDKSDPFAYSNTPSCYTSDRFYSVIIDTKASKQSTAG